MKKNKDNKKSYNPKTKHKPHHFASKKNKKTEKILMSEEKNDDNINNEEEDLKNEGIENQEENEIESEKGERNKEEEGNKQSNNDDNEFSIKLTMIYFDQCDPKKCSGKKLERLGLLSEMKFHSNYPGILLTPTGKKISSIEDHEIIKENGICVLDCSWAKFDELHLNLRKIETRSLPYMVAVNPVNYGKAYKLNCAEAIAATLFLGGFEKEARFIMDHFNWGKAFFEVNKEIFELYKQAKSSEEVKQIGEKFVQDEIEWKEKKKQRDGLEEFNKEVELMEKEEEEEEIDMNIFKNINIDKINEQILAKEDENKGIKKQIDDEEEEEEEEEK